MMVVIWLVMMMVVMIMMIVNDDDGNLYHHKSMNPPKLDEVHVTTGAKIEMTFTPWSKNTQVRHVKLNKNENLDMADCPAMSFFFV